MSTKSDHSPADPTGQSGMSLDKLGEAFARLLGKVGAETKSEDDHDADTTGADVDAAEDVGDAVALADGDREVTPLGILEAMLFVGNEQNQALSRERAAALMRGVDESEIDDFVEQLNVKYAERGAAYEVVFADDGYRLNLREDLERLRDKFYGRIREARLSQAAIDVLAIVAYKQPLTRQQIDAYRGKPSASLINHLVRRELLRVDRPDARQRRMLYATSDRFLQLFGMASVQELPQSDDVDL